MLSPGTPGQSHKSLRFSSKARRLLRELGEQFLYLVLSIAESDALLHELSEKHEVRGHRVRLEHLLALDNHGLRAAPLFVALILDGLLAPPLPVVVGPDEGLVLVVERVDLCGRRREHLALRPATLCRGELELRHIDDGSGEFPVRLRDNRVWVLEPAGHVGPLSGRDFVEKVGLVEVVARFVEFARAADKRGTAVEALTRRIEVGLFAKADLRTGPSELTFRLLFRGVCEWCCFWFIKWPIRNKGREPVVAS